MCCRATARRRWNGRCPDHGVRPGHSSRRAEPGCSPRGSVRCCGLRAGPLRERRASRVRDAGWREQARQECEQRCGRCGFEAAQGSRDHRPVRSRDRARARLLVRARARRTAVRTHGTAPRAGAQPAGRGGGRRGRRRRSAPAPPASTATGRQLHRQPATGRPRRAERPRRRPRALPRRRTRRDDRLRRRRTRQPTAAGPGGTRARRPRPPGPARPRGPADRRAAPEAQDASGGTAAYQAAAKLLAALPQTRQKALSGPGSAEQIHGAYTAGHPGTRRDRRRHRPRTARPRGLRRRRHPRAARPRPRRRTGRRHPRAAARRRSTRGRQPSARLHRPPPSRSPTVCASRRALARLPRDREPGRARDRLRLAPSPAPEVNTAEQYLARLTDQPRSHAAELRLQTARRWTPPSPPASS